MEYTQIVQGRFLERPNRFIALAEIQGQIEKCHVKNTGRCRELLIPGTEVWLEKSHNPARKTKYDLTAVNKGGNIINMDSQAPNKMVKEWLECRQNVREERGFKGLKGEAWEPKVTYIKPECKYGGSRIDFYVEAETEGKERDLRKIFLEVKGVTLEEEGIARFPDAPTERGVKHMLELEKALREGYEAWILFVIQMKGIRWFEPNDRTHPQFGETLRQVQKSGVRVLACDCQVTPEKVCLDLPIEVKL
ncbi:MAG: DNA/RNA nuclease SfsA [Lachnospiraceae bacterium]|nr:DNA/RNA nuclease SfsA [Lachnospiraceae bacterium]